MGMCSLWYFGIHFSWKALSQSSQRRPLPDSHVIVLWQLEEEESTPVFVNNSLFTVVTAGFSLSFFSFASIRFRFFASFSSSALHLASFFFSNTSWYLLDVMAYGCLSICLFPLRFGVSGHTRNSFIPSVWTTFITQETLLLALLVDCTAYISLQEPGSSPFLWLFKELFCTVPNWSVVNIAVSFGVNYVVCIPPVGVEGWSHPWPQSLPIEILDSSLNITVWSLFSWKYSQRRKRVKNSSLFSWEIISFILLNFSTFSFPTMFTNVVQSMEASSLRCIVEGSCLPIFSFVGLLLFLPRHLVYPQHLHLLHNKCIFKRTKHTTCRQILPHCFIQLWHAFGSWRRVVRFTVCWWAKKESV